MKKKALRRRVAARCTLFSILLFMLAFAQVRAMAAELAGNVQAAGLPIAGSTVTLYATHPDAPTQLARGKTDENGAFNLNVDQTPADRVLYLVAKGGTPQAAADKSPNDAIALMAVLGTELPNTVTVNEFTTVASVWTSAQFLEGDGLSGQPLGLRIAAGNVSNFVDLATGGYGGTIQDALNSGETTTMANFATLATPKLSARLEANPLLQNRRLFAQTPPQS